MYHKLSTSLLAEFIGTFALIFIGAGAGALGATDGERVDVEVAAAEEGHDPVQDSGLVLQLDDEDVAAHGGIR